MDTIDALFLMDSAILISILVLPVIGEVNFLMDNLHW